MFGRSYENLVSRSSGLTTDDDFDSVGQAIIPGSSAVSPAKKLTSSWYYLHNTYVDSMSRSDDSRPDIEEMLSLYGIGESMNSTVGIRVVVFLIDFLGKTFIGDGSAGAIGLLPLSLTRISGLEREMLARCEEQFRHGTVYLGGSQSYLGAYTR